MKEAENTAVQRDTDGTTATAHRHLPLALGAAGTVGAAALLFPFARSFDFVCDDAFIALRYAKNWVELGAPVYNADERVEGFTSFLFTAATALLYRFGVDPPRGAQVLGGIGSLTLLGATWHLARSASSRRLGAQSIGAMLATFGLALSAPVAAWTFGGLETTFFAGLALVGVVALARAAVLAQSTRATTLHAATAGLLFGVSTLARPEGALFGGLGGVVLAAFLRKTPHAFRRLAAYGAAYVAIVAPLVIFRLAYYGYPLPNTFYVKSTGVAGELASRGGRYLELGFLEIGPAVIVAGLMGLYLPDRLAFPPDRAAVDAALESAHAVDTGRARQIVVWTGRLLIPTFIAYVLRVGGDFLDLYRFFVPVLPFFFLGLARWVGALDALTASRVPSAATRAVGLGFASSALLVWYGDAQRTLAKKAMEMSEPDRASRHLEPLGWTREYARRWSAMGQWIQRHAKPGDTMAVGAAGAMPYWAELPNLDLFGLCDEYVAHHGDPIGSRPGHQRFAPHAYILQKRPTFLFMNAEDITPNPGRVGADAGWNGQGWVWAEATLDTSSYDLPRRLYMRFLLRKERAEELRESPDLKIAVGR